MSMEIAALDAKAQASPLLPFAFSPVYMRLTAQFRGGQAFMARDLCIGASMPLILRQRAGLRILTCLHAPYAHDGRRLAREAESAFLEHFVNLARSDLRAHRVAAPENWCLFASAPDGAMSCKFASYVVDLRQDEQVLWAGLHQKHRNAIKKAAKSSVRIETGSNVLETCHGIYAETMQRNGLQAHELAFFRALADRFAGCILPLVSFKENEPLSAAFILHGPEAGYYVYGGTVAGGAAMGANTLLHYHAMLGLRARGVRHYDFVGARIGVSLTDRQAGIQRFKARFGGELRQGVLWKMDLAPAICRAHDMGRQAWARVRGQTVGGDLIDQIIAASKSSL